MQKKKFIQHLPNILTAVNMMLGMSAIFILICEGFQDKIKVGSVLIILGAIIDGIDGKIARCFNVCSNMGKQLDSFADQITFGVAPVCLLVATKAFSQNIYLLPILLLFPTSAAFRLARYNLGEFSDYFLGLPTTAAGLIVAAAMLVYDIFYGVYSTAFVISALCVVVVLSLLKVSKIKVNRIKCKRCK